jgi:hypothetical protein
VVDGADHPVEVDDAVEELPGDVALERLEEGVGAHHVPAGGPVDVHEVVVAAELELAEPEAQVALGVALDRLDLGPGLGGGHRMFLLAGPAAASP